VADPLSAVQLAEADLIGDEFAAVMDAAPGYLLAALAPVVKYVRAEGITLPRLSATGYKNIPPHALPALVIAAACSCSGGDSPFNRKLLAIADAIESH
jgi:hypothetical protein